MLNNTLSIDTVSECAILIRFSDSISIELPSFISQVSSLIYAQHADSIMNLTPAYTSLLIEYLPYRTSEQTMLINLSEILYQVEQYQEPAPANLITLPVYYNPSVAPDLDWMSHHCDLSPSALIEAHTAQEYTVCAIGFAPGFAFLGGLDPKLAAPRIDTPRLSVAKGSVGIGNNQTAVYPSDSPGGWRIIGNCPLDLFDPHSEQLSPFRVGDKVRFEAINYQQFIELGGQAPAQAATG